MSRDNRLLISEGQPFQILQKAMESERMHHAYLLSGPEGVGKTALALHFAHALLCRAEDPKMRPCFSCASCRKIGAYAHPDFRLVFPFVSMEGFKTVAKELGLKKKSKDDDGGGDDDGWENLYLKFLSDSAQNLVADPFRPSVLDQAFADKNREISIDQIRAISETVLMPPSESPVMVFVVPDVDKMAAAPANAFLKTLEEPPRFVRFLLITSRPNALLPTIRSRCQTVKFTELEEGEIARFLLKQTSATDAQAAEAAQLAAGSLNNALLVLDSLGNGADDEEGGNGTALESCFELLNWLAAPSLRSGLAIAAKMEAPVSEARKRMRLLSILLRELARIQRTGIVGPGALSQRLSGNAARLPRDTYTKLFDKLTILDEGLDRKVNGRMLNASFILSLLK